MEHIDLPLRRCKAFAEGQNIQVVGRIHATPNSILATLKYRSVNSEYQESVHIAVFNLSHGGLSLADRSGEGFKLMCNEKSIYPITQIAHQLTSSRVGLPWWDPSELSNSYFLSKLGERIRSLYRTCYCLDFGFYDCTG
jgi:hypothetical protein